MEKALITHCTLAQHQPADKVSSYCSSLAVKTKTMLYAFPLDTSYLLMVIPISSLTTDFFDELNDVVSLKNMGTFILVQNHYN